MGKELRLLLHLVEQQSEMECNGFTLYTGKIGSHDVCAMQCGIGKVNAAIGTMTMIDAYAPELIINTGVAGGVGKTIRQMDIVVGESIAYHDIWCGPGTSYGEAAGCPLYFSSESRIVGMLKQLEQARLKFGIICSGDKFISCVEEIQEIQSHFPDTLAVDMESASIAHTCYLKHVPVLVVRVISDTPGMEKDNSAQYDNFWESAPEHTFQVLSLILQNLN